MLQTNQPILLFSATLTSSPSESMLNMRSILRLFFDFFNCRHFRGSRVQKWTVPGSRSVQSRDLPVRSFSCYHVLNILPDYSPHSIWCLSHPRFRLWKGYAMKDVWMTHRSYTQSLKSGSVANPFRPRPWPTCPNHEPAPGRSRAVSNVCEGSFPSYSSFC